MSTVRMGEHADRYEIVADDGATAGAAHFLEHDGARVFFHTKVDDAYAGQGLARELVEHALAETREAGLKVMPVCPYVAKVVAGDQQWADVVVPVTQSALDAVQARTKR